jgi:hypothetical protein
MSHEYGMDATGRKWVNPSAVSLRGPDGRAVAVAFNSLTEYFNRAIGMWGEWHGTTDANGELTVAHGAPFTPSCVLITEHAEGLTGHQQGSFHIDSVDKDNVTIHFLISTSGNDRANVAVGFYMLCLP